MTGIARLAAVVIALCSTSALAPGALATPGAVSADNAIELPIVRELNRVRAAQGLRPLVTSPPLRRAADGHAADMGLRGFFSHTSADGTTFDRRIARFYGATRSSYWTVGENLLWASPDVSPGRAVRMWMDSPGHRRNILNPRYREIGIAAVRVAAAPGVFNGLDVTIVVTDFGARSSL